jgi:ribokinase
MEGSQIVSNKNPHCQNPHPIQPDPPDVIGIGLCTVDLLFVVPELPAFGKTVRASKYLRQGGGPVATALVTLARLGISTRFIGKVGDDPEGAFIREEFQEEGVDTSSLIAEPNAFSLAVLVLVDQTTGERCFTPRPDTCSPLTAADLNRTEITSTRILHLDDADEPSIQAAKWAKAAGVKVVFDGTWSNESVTDLLPCVDIPIVSDIFVQEWMPGASPDVVLHRLYEFGGQIAVVTLGERGCVAKWERGVFAFPAFPIDVVDTTGAGDAFHGGFIYGLLRDWSVEETIRFASAVAALNCRELGGRSGLPTLAEVERFLASASMPSFKAV